MLPSGFEQKKRRTRCSKCSGGKMKKFLKWNYSRLVEVCQATAAARLMHSSRFYPNSAFLLYSCQRSADEGREESINMLILLIWVAFKCCRAITATEFKEPLIVPFWLKHTDAHTHTSLQRFKNWIWTLILGTSRGWDYWGFLKKKGK